MDGMMMTYWEKDKKIDVSDRCTGSATMRLEASLTFAAC